MSMSNFCFILVKSSYSRICDLCMREVGNNSADVNTHIVRCASSWLILARYPHSLRDANLSCHQGYQQRNCMHSWSVFSGVRKHTSRTSRKWRTQWSSRSSLFPPLDSSPPLTAQVRAPWPIWLAFCRRVETWRWRTVAWRVRGSRFCLQCTAKNNFGEHLRT